MVPRFGPIVSPSFQSPKLVASPAPPSLLPSRASPWTKLDRSPPNATDSNLKFISIKPRSYFAGVELQTWEQSSESNRIPPLHTGRGIIDQFQAALSLPPPSPGYPSISVTRRGGEGQFGGRIYDFSLTTPDGNNSPSVSTSLGLISNSAFGKIRENERTFQIWSRDFVFSIMARSRTVLNWTKFFFFFSISFVEI